MTPTKQARDRTMDYSEDYYSETVSDLEDEYRDVVYDVDQSRALV